MSITNPISTTNGDVNITSGTGTISIGADAASKSIVIGNNTGSTSVEITVGSGGLRLPAVTNYGSLVSDSSGVITSTGPATAGFVLTSNGTSGVPTFQAASSGAMTWNNVTGTTATMVAGQGYVSNNASQVVLTLPTTAAFGTVISVIGNGAGGWRVAQNAGQQIQIGNVASTVGVTGYIQSANRYDSIQLVCIVANTTWSSLGGPLSSGITLN